MNSLIKSFQVRQLALAVSCLSLGVASEVFAQDSGQVEEVLVFGRNQELIGTANTASEGSYSGADLLIRPLVKTAELLESMPGMVAVQHSGSGKANQYFLRGFNLDHGTDYSVIMDGVPMNMRSHGHGQGYLDVNGIIPETVERIDYRKGPYGIDLGDFSLAGASFINTIDRIEQNYVSLEAGEDGWQRYVGGMSQDMDDAVFTLIGEYKQYDGPWGKPENLDHISLWGKYLADTGFGTVAVTVSGYEAEWEPTEQIPERVIGSSVCADAFCVLDSTAHGETSRWVLNTEFTGDNWEGNLFAQTYDWTMSSNPTYDYQINQFDKRKTFGGRGEITLVDEADYNIVSGAEFRYDDGSRIGVEHTEQGVFMEDITSSGIEESSYGAFVDSTWYLGSALRLMGGLRADRYSFDVKALNSGSYEGSESEDKISFKGGIAWEASDILEFYGNYGQGFHSNDARGVVNQVDPVPGLSDGTGYEAGMRTTLGDLKVTAAYWWLDQDSELIFVGDSNAVEPKGGSEREGLELTMFWQPIDWLGVDASYADSEARYTDNPEGDYVEQAVEEAAQLGVTVTRNDWDVSFRVRYLGPYALSADNGKRAESLTTANLRVSKRWNNLDVFAEVINLFDTDGKEIVYDYPAWVAGFDPAGLTSEDIDCGITNCTMSRVTMPRALRVGVKLRFD